MITIIFMIVLLIFLITLWILLRSNQALRNSQNKAIKKSGNPEAIRQQSTIAITIKTTQIFTKLSEDEKRLFAEEEKNGYVLAIEQGAPKNKNYVLIGNHIVLGRSPSNEVTVEDQRVSEKHALITIISGEQITIKDLNSTNGTYVNDRKITETNLCEDDLISIGKTKLRFKKDE
ncbi:MAG: hypothetical protein ACD_79C01021G0002 [uncultured bacterium]|nr:MAG: hypothetical protein ACD_79C01021G0002 [uncultured bacterium]